MTILKYIIEFTFSIALFVNALLFIPQILKIFKTKSAKDISLLTFTGFLLIQLAVIAHGFIIQDYLLISGYLFSIITCGSVVTLALFYRQRQQFNKGDISLADVIAQAPGHIYWKDKNGVHLGCNTNNWQDNNLKSLQEYIGATDYDLFSKEEAEKLRTADSMAMQTGELQIIYELSTVEGITKLYLSHKAPLRNRDKDIIGIVGVSLDVTEARKEEMERLAFLENIIALMPGHIYWKDKQGVLLGCNDLQAKSAGLASRHQIIGKTDYEMPWKDQADSLRKIDQEVIQTGQAKTVEEMSILADGKEAIFLSQKVPLRNNNGEIVGLLGISFDITEKKKQAEQELQETKHKLEGMTLVSASIAHELRTPLASLNLNTNILKECLPVFIASYEMAQTARLPIKSIGRDRYQLLNDIIPAMESEIRSALTFIDMQLVNLKPSIVSKSDETFSMVDCIQEALARYPFEPGERELVHFVTQHDFAVKGKKMLLIHLFFNLIKNALYYIAVADKGEITVWLDHTTSYNIVYFKDTGAGIPQSILPKIFDRFFTKTPHGAGIGLTFCKMVMQSFEGTITCESNEREHTIFQLTFPHELKLESVLSGFADAVREASEKTSLQADSVPGSPKLISGPALR